MADHNLDREPGLPRIADDINTLKNQISELRTLQLQGLSALSVKFTNLADSSGTLTNNQIAEFLNTFTPSAARPNEVLFGFMEFTLYEGSIASGNEIGNGNIRDLNYQWWQWYDWGLSDNKNIVSRVYLKNLTGSTQTIYLRTRWRYLASASPSSTSA